MARGATINRFEVAEPSLEMPFVEHVGRCADDDEGRLAEAARPARATAGGAA
jgi:hypothetical protein